MRSKAADDRPLFRELFADRLGRVSVRSLQIIVIVTLGCVVVYALVQVKLVVIPALIALIVSAAISPVVNWLRRRGVPSALATWIVLLAGMLLFGGLGWLIVFAVRNQWSELVKSASDGLDQLQHYLTHGPLPIDQGRLENARTAIIALVDAVAIGAGLFILQVPLALPLAVIVFLTAFIPMIGATIAGVLAALVTLVTNGPVVALIVVGIVVAVNELEGNLLQPVVMAQSLKLHPLVILIALTVGTKIAVPGPVGHGFAALSAAIVAERARKSGDCERRAAYAGESVDERPPLPVFAAHRRRRRRRADARRRHRPWPWIPPLDAPR